MQRFAKFVNITYEEKKKKKNANEHSTSIFFFFEQLSLDTSHDFHWHFDRLISHADRIVRSLEKQPTICWIKLNARSVFFDESPTNRRNFSKWKTEKPFFLNAATVRNFIQWFGFRIKKCNGYLELKNIYIYIYFFLSTVICLTFLFFSVRYFCNIRLSLPLISYL